ncbi:CHAT domain-containing protein [Flammeovirga agarivorans]|uniref:CHAT domain-containing protein n=1 Tax=Flammeovirga agarivorans TaxID=2726742 RepID=A0A7X8XYW6_9BACT|nr:CHAT domain-containing protein [Flammeovirga agarivorans]NLR94607.1 CHAT domain-containing protein [Flammeovirga agarivorans]
MKTLILLFAIFSLSLRLYSQSIIKEEEFINKGTHKFIDEDLGKITYDYSIKYIVGIQENSGRLCKDNNFTVFIEFKDLDINQIRVNKQTLKMVEYQSIYERRIDLKPSFLIGNNKDEIQVNFLDLQSGMNYRGKRYYCINEKVNLFLGTLVQTSEASDIKINVNFFGVTDLPETSISSYILDKKDEENISVDFTTTEYEFVKNLVEINSHNYRLGHAVRGVNTRRSLVMKTMSEKTQDIMQNSLEAFNANDHRIGILMYNYSNGYLYSTFFRPKSKVLIQKNKIKKKELERLVNDTNQLLRNGNLIDESRSLKVKTNNKATNQELLASYDKLKKILYFNESLLSSFDHLVIIPTHNIGTIPFSAIRFSDQSYFIDHLSYSIVPSVVDYINNIMDNFFTLTGTDPSEIEVFFQVLDKRNQYSAVIELDEQDSYIFQLGSAVNFDIENKSSIACFYNPNFSYSSEFTQLPGTKLEVDLISERIHDYFDVKKYSGDKAVYDNVIENIYKNDILYFGTHGVTDPKNPYEGSYLALSKQSNGVDKITGRDILNLSNNHKFDAWLTVMSACNTGLGASYDWGIIGLSRAFSKAGVNHIMMSLWSIDDKYTAKFMELYFECLVEGSPLFPYSPYQKAIKRFRKEVSDNPYYWASFSIMGVPF